MPHSWPWNVAWTFKLSRHIQGQRKSLMDYAVLSGTSFSVFKRTVVVKSAVKKWDLGLVEW